MANLNGDGVNDVSFRLMPGEMLGLAGLEGQGQSNLFKTLAGLSRRTGGSIGIEGAPAEIRSPRAARRLGVVLVPEERKSEGLFTDLSTAANISLPAIDTVSPAPFHQRHRRKAPGCELTPKVSLQDSYLPLGIGALSGGNQQKAILARALLAGPRCLLLFDPTRGVDVGAKQHIYGMMRNFVREGGAILFYSTELDELVGLCDRCLVPYRSAIAGELQREAMSQDRILSLASGHSGRNERAGRQAAIK